jgi:hypothetical protein
MCPTKANGRARWRWSAWWLWGGGPKPMAAELFPVSWPWRMEVEMNNRLGSLAPRYENNPPGDQPFDDWAANMLGEPLRRTTAGELVGVVVI